MLLQAALHTDRQRHLRAGDSGSARRPRTSCIAPARTIILARAEDPGKGTWFCARDGSRIEPMFRALLHTPETDPNAGPKPRSPSAWHLAAAALPAWAERARRSSRALSMDRPDAGGPVEWRLLRLSSPFHRVVTGVAKERIFTVDEVRCQLRRSPGWRRSPCWQVLDILDLLWPWATPCCR